MTSRPARTVNADGSHVTLGQLLAALLPLRRFADRSEIQPAVMRNSADSDGPPPTRSDRRPTAEGPEGQLKQGPEETSDPSAAPPSLDDGNRMPEEGDGGNHPEGAGNVLSSASGPSESDHQVEATEPALPRPQMSGGTVFGPVLKSLSQPLGNHEAEGKAEDLQPTHKAIVAGIMPPLETPLVWLHYHLHAPDYFLYVVVGRL